MAKRKYTTKIIKIKAIIMATRTEIGIKVAVNGIKTIIHTNTITTTKVPRGSGTRTNKETKPNKATFKEI